MKSGLVALGILILIGMFVFGNIIVTPQQREQIKITTPLCSSALGTIGGALSGDIAETCRQIESTSQILSMEPYIYLGGGILLILGLVIPGGKKEVKIIREVVDRFDDDEEDEPVRKKGKKTKRKKGKSKGRFCPECGSKISSKAKFCTECGEEIE